MKNKILITWIAGLLILLMAQQGMAIITIDNASTNGWTSSNISLLNSTKDFNSPNITVGSQYYTWDNGVVGGTISGTAVASEGFLNLSNIGTWFISGTTIPKDDFNMSVRIKTVVNGSSQYQTATVSPLWNITSAPRYEDLFFIRTTNTTTNELYYNDFSNVVSSSGTVNRYDWNTFLYNTSGNDAGYWLNNTVMLSNTRTNRSLLKTYMPFGKIRLISSISSAAIAYFDDLRVWGNNTGNIYIFNQPATSNSYINRTKVIGYNLDANLTIDLYVKSNKSSSWYLVKSNVTNDTWYDSPIISTSLDFYIKLNGNSSDAPIFNNLVYDNNVSIISYLNTTNGLNVSFNYGQISSIMLNGKETYSDILNGLYISDYANKTSFDYVPVMNISDFSVNNGNIMINYTYNGLNINITYKQIQNYLQVDVNISDITNLDRAIQIAYNLPVNASGWNWWDEINNSRVINSSIDYTNVMSFGTNRFQSIYPISYIGNNTMGLSVAIPMDRPRIYRLSYNITNGSKIEYDIGLSNATTNINIGAGRSNLTFYIYSNPYPEWNFRGSLNEYYNIFPQYFLRKNHTEGTRMVYATTVFNISIPTPNDFGFKYIEDGNSNPKFVEQNGWYNLPYSEPWGWWRSYGSNPVQPNYLQLMSNLSDDNVSIILWKTGITIGNISNATINSLITNSSNYGSMLDSSLLWVQFSTWMQSYPTNPSPNIPLPNRYAISYDEIYLSSPGGFIDNWTYGLYQYLNSTVSHTGSNSAKIIMNMDTNTSTSGKWESDTFTVLPNTNYSFSFWGKTLNASAGYKPAGRFIEVHSDGSTTQTDLSLTSATSDWVYKSVFVTTNVSTVSGYVYFNIYKGNGTVWFDDVNLSLVSNGINLIYNNGFENNTGRNHSDYQINGVYIDSIQTTRWSILPNYNTSQYMNTTNPLVFDYSDSRPIILSAFSHQEYLNNISGIFNTENKILEGNIVPNLYWLYVPYLDVLGSEVTDVELSSDSYRRRVVSGKKTNANLMNYIGNNISSSKLQQYLQSSTFFGIFPGMYYSDYSNSSAYWMNSSLYERDRIIWTRYIPIIRSISSAGWEPITYATSNNSQVWLERYGSNLTTRFYIAARTENAANQSVQISLNLTALGMNTSWTYQVVELIEPATITPTKSGNFLNWTDNIATNDTLVYNVTGFESSIVNITIPANSWGMFNNWSSNLTFSQIAANESNDVAYTWYNTTSGDWEDLYVGQTFNQNNIVPYWSSVLGYFNAQTTITATVITPANTGLTAGWNMLFVEGGTNRTLSEIQTNIALSCTVNDLYKWNTTLSDYDNAGTSVVQPNEGFIVDVAGNCNWVRTTI